MIFKYIFLQYLVTGRLDNSSSNFESVLKHSFDYNVKKHPSWKRGWINLPIASKIVERCEKILLYYYQDVSLSAVSAIDAK